MRELAALGHTVVTFVSDSNHLDEMPTLPKRYVIEDVDGMTLCWVRTLKYSSAKSIARILSWFHFDLGLLRVPLKKLPRPDVIVASSLSLTSIIAAARLSRRFKARLIFEVRDIWPLTITEEGGFSTRNPLVRVLAAIERFGYGRADAIVGTMPSLEPHVREVSTSTTPVHCIPMGYDASWLTSETALPAAYTDAGVPLDRFLIGYAGTIGTTNALETLFECATALQADPSMHFVIVGGGDLLGDFTARYGSLPNVTFVGKVPQASIRAVLAQFDVLYLSTFPSRVWAYGQSLNKLIDYMLAGKPVIASYSGFPSMINEAESGTYVPAGDTTALVDEIRRLSVLSPEELSLIGARGREWLLRHRGYPALAREYESILFGPTPS